MKELVWYWWKIYFFSRICVTKMKRIECAPPSLKWRWNSRIDCVCVCVCARPVLSCEPSRSSGQAAVDERRCVIVGKSDARKHNEEEENQVHWLLLHYESVIFWCTRRWMRARFASHQRTGCLFHHFSIDGIKAFLLWSSLPIPPADAISLFFIRRLHLY